MEKKFTIECQMEERWIPHFMSFLKQMESMGNIGHSDLIAFYADGDGDFRPKFNTEIEYKKEEMKNNGVVDFFDAG